MWKRDCVAESLRDEHRTANQLDLNVEGGGAETTARLLGGHSWDAGPTLPSASASPGHSGLRVLPDAETLGGVSLEVISRWPWVWVLPSPAGGCRPVYRAPLRCPLGSSGKATQVSMLWQVHTRGTQRPLHSLALGESPRIWILQKETAVRCVTGHPHLGSSSLQDGFSPHTSLAPSHDNIGCRGGEEAPSSRSSSWAPVSCPQSHTPALVSAAPTLKGRTLLPGYRVFSLLNWKLSPQLDHQVIKD